MAHLQSHWGQGFKPRTWGLVHPQQCPGLHFALRQPQASEWEEGTRGYRSDFSTFRLLGRGHFRNAGLAVADGSQGLAQWVPAGLRLCSHLRAVDTPSPQVWPRLPVCAGDLPLVQEDICSLAAASGGPAFLCSLPLYFSSVCVWMRC